MSEVESRYEVEEHREVDLIIIIITILIIIMRWTSDWRSSR